MPSRRTLPCDRLGRQGEAHRCDREPPSSTSSVSWVHRDAPLPNAEPAGVVVDEPSGATAVNTPRTRCEPRRRMWTLAATTTNSEGISSRRSGGAGADARWLDLSCPSLCAGSGGIDDCRRRLATQGRTYGQSQTRGPCEQARCRQPPAHPQRGTPQRVASTMGGRVPVTIR